MIQKNQLKILFMEDVPSDVDLAVLELRKEKLLFEYTTVCTRNDLLKALKNFKPDLVISDYMMPSFNGLQALKETKEFNSEIPFILYTGSVNEETAVACLKAGAQDYIIKEHMTRLPYAVKEALEQVRIFREKRASELLLKENEEKLQSIFSVAPVGIGLVVDRILIEVNDSFCKMIGYKRKELIGRSSEILYKSREEYEKVGKDKYDQIAEKGTGSVETLLKTKDGQILNAIIASAPLDRNDLSKGVTFTVLDITARKIAETALLESEDRFRKLYNDAPAGLYRTNCNGEILLANLALVKMLGFQSFEELAAINLNTSEIGTTGTTTDRQKFIERIEREGEINDLEAIWICRDGREMYVRENAKAVYDSDGKILWYDGTVEDITHRKKMQEALKESQQLFETLAKTSPVGIFRTNSEASTTYVNPKWLELSGLTFEEAMGFGWTKAVHPDDRIQIEAGWKLHVQLQTSSAAEYRFLRSDGSIVWVMGNAVPEWIDKKITGYIGTVTDITDRKLTEKALQESEEKYRRIFDNVQDLFYETTIDGTILEVSPSIRIMSKGQYTRDELVGKSIFDFYSDPDERPALVSQIMGQGSISDFEITLKNKDGSRVPCSLSSIIIRDAQGRPERIIGSVRDITDRKNVSEALKIGKEKAEASDKLKTTFLNNISHEVRTPLNGILGFAEIISQTDLTEAEKSDSLSMLHQSSDRLLNTITNFMDISLLTSGSMSVNKKNFFPGREFKYFYDYFKQKCSDKKLELFLEIPEQDENLSISTDPEIFRKIISHLLNNAIKFTEEGSIHFGFKIHKGELECFVKDTGIGIGTESLGSVFDNFTKEDRGPLKITEGSGLGLSIAKGMSEIIGGKIRVDSESGIGSCFFLTVPLVRDTEVILAGTPVKDQRKVITGFQILVAEDDDTNFYYLNALLTRETGATVLHAVNGREAIELFKTNTDIRLILMDIKMPEIDGLEATRQIRLLNRNVYIIAITAYAMSGDEEKMIVAGCDGYLSKPINRKSLFEKIAEFVKI